jgi:RHS repeat-associated protein
MKKFYNVMSLSLSQQHHFGKPRRNNTVKELDHETRFYYFGARYLDPKASRWISGDPALGEYLPSAPVNEEARKRNGSLPGMGGVFNYVNLHVYHYGGNNPVRYVDIDGEFIINNVAEGVPSARDYLNNRSRVELGRNVMMIGQRTPYMVIGRNHGIVLERGLNNILTRANNLRNTVGNNVQVIALARKIRDGIYQIDIQVNIATTDSRGNINIESRSGTIAFADKTEVGEDPVTGRTTQSMVDEIANDVINTVLNLPNNTKLVE